MKYYIFEKPVFYPFKCLAVLIALGFLAAPLTTANAQEADERAIESKITRILKMDGRKWDYDRWWGGEWKLEFDGGELEFEPEDEFYETYANNANSVETAIRRALAGPTEWEYETLEGAWEAETELGEIEYDPEPSYNGEETYGYYDDAYEDDDWFYDWYDYDYYYGAPY